MVKIKDTVLIKIPNPDLGPGFGEFPVIYNNELYRDYITRTNKGRLVKYSNGGYKFINIPDTNRSFYGDLFVVSNSLYCIYGFDNSYRQLAKIDLHLLGYSEPEIEELSVYPNPAHDYITLTTEDLPIHYRIYNISGILVTDRISFTNTISLEDLANGIYLLQVKNRSYKLIKQ